MFVSATPCGTVSCAESFRERLPFAGMTRSAVSLICVPSLMRTSTARTSPAVANAVTMSSSLTAMHTFVMSLRSMPLTVLTPEVSRLTREFSPA